MPYLTELLESIYAQTLDREEFEVIAVDDGATDGSGEELDRFAAEHSNLTVIHQENWGWPGQPRNRAMDAAKGDYILFCDSDDRLDPHAAEDLVTFADKHQSDIVIPQLASINGRWVQTEQFTRTQIDSDLELAVKTLGPMKLFRRSFMEDNELRFPEENVRLEDGIMLSRAYFLAKRVSTLTGRDYYQLRSRSDGNNISSRAADLAGYTDSIATVSDNFLTYCPDKQQAQRMVVDLYRRKCLKFYKPARFLKASDDRKRELIRVHQDFQNRYISQEAEDTLSEPFRTRSQLVRSGNIDGLTKLAELQTSTQEAQFAALRFGLRTLACDVEFTGRNLDYPTDFALRVKDRKRGTTWTAPLASPPRWWSVGKKQRRRSRLISRCSAWRRRIPPHSTSTSSGQLESSATRVACRQRKLQ